MKIRRNLGEEKQGNKKEYRNLNERISAGIKKDLRRYDTNVIALIIVENKDLQIMRRKHTQSKKELYKLKDN